MEDRLKLIADKIEQTDDAFEKINLMNQLAWELRLTDPRESLAISEQSYRSAIDANYIKGRAEALKAQCSTHNTLSNYDLSFQKAIEALEMFRKLNDRGGEANVITMLGKNSYVVGDYENALKYNLLAINIREELNDIPGIVTTLINIGNIYSVKKDLDTSLKNFLKGLELAKTHPATLNSQAVLLGKIGSIYANQEQYDKALEYYFESTKLLKSDSTNLTITSNYTNIAEVYFMIGDMVNSEKYYSSAYKLAADKENKFSEATALLGLGKVAERLKKSGEAIQHLEKALAVAESVPLKRLLPEIFLSLSEAWTLKKDFAAALDYHKRFCDEKEREFNEETVKKIQNLLILHQVDTLKKESESQRLSNNDLKKLNEEIENTNRKIFESIDYAKHIQDSILPHAKSLKQYFSDSFVLSRPKDVISGDFFWLYEKENDILVAAVDCTGHGVSGTLMSVVANSLLNQVTANHWVPNPSFILNEVNHYMGQMLTAHDESGLRDSMGLAMCSINKTHTALLFSGAHNPLYIISEGILTEYKGDNISMGNSSAVKFTSHHIKLKKRDCIYIFTDGYADQKGGPERKKFYYPPFKDLLLKIHLQPMEKQKVLLHEAIDEWMGNEKQIDDMLIIGIKI